MKEIDIGGGSVVDRLMTWISEANPQTESENMVIRYGMEVLLDNCLKLLLLFIVGFIAGRGWETVVFMIVFCSLRMQAGGYHAQTGWGCGLCMVVIWLIGMLGNTLIELSVLEIVGLFSIEILAILWKAPKTVNRNCYTWAEVRKRKTIAIAIATLSMGTAVYSEEWRTLIVCAVVLEIITLFPERKGGWSNEEKNGEKNSKHVQMDFA